MKEQVRIQAVASNFIPVIHVEPTPRPISNSGSAYDPRFRNVEALIVKVTHRCNLDCAYCYERITAGKDMTLETFAALVDRVAASTINNHVQFIFHGGEPSLMPNSWLASASNYARERFSATGKSITLSMQSNALALNKAKLETLHELGIGLGVSLDGPPQISGALRGRSELACSNFKLARDMGLRPGLLLTINETNVKHFDLICRWLQDDLRVTEFKANVVSAVGRGAGMADLQAESVFEAYRDILEYMIETHGAAVIEDNLAVELCRFFEAQAGRKRSQSASLCLTKSCGAGSRVLGITPHGNLLPCGRFQWDDEAYFLGGLDENSDDEQDSQGAFESRVQGFHNLVPEVWVNCADCRARDVCSYGCQAFAARSAKRVNVDCLPTKMRYDYYACNSQRLIPVFQNISRRKQRELPIGQFPGQTLTLSGRSGEDGYRDSYNDYSDFYRDRSRAS